MDIQPPIIGKLMVLVVAILHVGFGALEMFYWDKPLGRKIFRSSETLAKEGKVLAANQGLYNYFLAAGLFASFFLPIEAAHYFRFFFLGCVVVAGVYGAATVSKRILLFQAIPAALGFFFVALGL